MRIACTTSLRRAKDAGLFVSWIGLLMFLLYFSVCVCKIIFDYFCMDLN